MHIYIYIYIYIYINLLSFLLRCGTRPNEWGAQWDWNSVVKVCKSILQTITPSEALYTCVYIYIYIYIYNIHSVCVRAFDFLFICKGNNFASIYKKLCESTEKKKCFSNLHTKPTPCHNCINSSPTILNLFSIKSQYLTLSTRPLKHNFNFPKPISQQRTPLKYI